MYLKIDIELESHLKQREKRDVESMKVIHDLKNPILAIKNTVADLDSINIDSKTKSLIISETTDLMEMLESLKMEFKMT